LISVFDGEDQIGGAPLSEDLRRIEAVLKILKTSDQLRWMPMDDLIGGCHRVCRARWPSYRLRWYEEPGDPLDFELQAELANHYPGTNGHGQKPILDAMREI